MKPFEYDPVELGRSDVEIDVESCGICHSDLSMLDNEWGIAQYPLVPGHEVVGTISATGENVNHLQIGDRVGLGWHSGYCMTCNICIEGDHKPYMHYEPQSTGNHGWKRCRRV